MPREKHSSPAPAPFRSAPHVVRDRKYAVTQSDLMQEVRLKQAAQEAIKCWTEACKRIRQAIDSGGLVEPGPLRVNRCKGVLVHF
jgi:hypothetical protein